MEIGAYNAAASSQLPMRVPPRREPSPGPSLEGRGKTDELREQFTQFVGEAFFGQMIKAMRSTVGKPAYFHGGRAEEVFQGQLDQQLSQHLTEASAARFAEPMFERQFPRQASSNEGGHQTLAELSTLQRK
jgi:Rod binding domain-containing protein